MHVSLLSIIIILLIIIVIVWMISTMSVWLTIVFESRWALMIYKWTSSTNFLMWSNIEVISTHWKSIHFPSVSSTSSFGHHMGFHIPFSIEISVSSWTSSSSVSIIRSIIIFDIVSELFFCSYDSFRPFDYYLFQ